MEIVKFNNVDITEFILSLEFQDEAEEFIGNAISTQVNMTVLNKNSLIKNILDYSFNINGKEYIAYEKPEKWDGEIQLVLYDSMLKLNKNYLTKLTYPTIISEQLTEISELTGVVIDKSSLTIEVLEKEVNWYDSVLTMREVIGYIAECDGKNAYIGNDNMLHFLKVGTSTKNIDVSLNYEKNELIKISKVTYTDGVTEPITNGDESENTLFINPNNLYITKDDVDRIYNLYKGFLFYSFKTFKTFGNINIFDLFIYDELPFIALTLKRTVNGGNSKDTLEVSGEFPIKDVEDIVSDNTVIRNKKIKAQIDHNKQTMQIVAEQQEQINSKIKNTISVSLTLNYVASQTYDQALDKFYPDYKTQPLVITATATDLTKNTVEATWVWKRKGREDQDYVDLIDGELADKNVLTISHNLSETVEYIAYATVSTGTASDSIEVSYNVLEDTTIDGETVQIVSTTNMFQEKDGDYDPSNISLLPKLFNCNFDIWSYSIDYGVTYTDIVPTDTQVVGDDDVKETNVLGIQQNILSNELLIDSEAECFLTTNVVVFKLKADKANAENTIAITKNSDVSQKVIDLVNAVDRLEKQYTEVSLELDGVNNSITSRVESMEETYNNGIGEINKQLTTVIQTSQYIEEQFNVLKEIVNENGGELQTITTYIRKTAKGIEVGELNAKVKTLMATSYFAILFNDEEVMKLEQNLLTIDRVRANIGFQLGGSIWNVKDYGFDISWGGE